PRSEVVPGSHHYIVGRIERVPPLALAVLQTLATTTRA
ncbi:MAG: hypothetical protein QOI20_1689, partial [Acidimicrobiaceae bacterium]|nr:hypothetical protein [Acidimicrobiaceae bacterium]